MTGGDPRSPDRPSDEDPRPPDRPADVYARPTGRNGRSADPDAGAPDPDGQVARDRPPDRREPDLSVAERAYEAVDRRLPYLFLAPALALVVGLVAYPAAWAVRLSLYEAHLVDLGSQEFVGLANYRTIAADPLFYRVLENTAAFVGASVVGQVGLGLGLALLLDRSWPGDRLARLLRLTYLLPWATTGVIVAFSWRFVYHPRHGLLNAALRWGGVANPPAWLNSVEWALLAVIVANVWRGMPFSLIFQTSGLQSIPTRLYEAAAVGGASTAQTLRHVTLPLLWPFVATNLLLVALFTINVFDVVFVMTGGGPLFATEVLSLHVYDTAFDVGAFGRANALAVVLFAINLALVGLYLGATRRGGRWTE